MQLIKCTL